MAAWSRKAAGHGVAERRLARIGRGALFPFRDLRVQIVLLVLLSTAATSLLTAWVSTEALEEFLVERMEQRFPALLEAKSRELNLWYDRLALDLETFVRDPAVRATVPTLLHGGDGQARRTLRRYLAGIVERLDRYRALVIVGPAGQPLAAVGHDPAIGAAISPAVAPTAGTRMRGVVVRGGRRLQIASIAVPGDSGALLLAAIDLRQLDRFLASGMRPGAAEIYVVDAAGEYVAGTLEIAGNATPYHGPPPRATGGVSTYENRTGARVIGAARPLARFGWTVVIERRRAATFEPIGALIATVLWIDFGIACVLVIVAALLALSIVRPLQALSTVADRVAAGETEVQLPRPRGARQLRALTRAFNQMTERLAANGRELEHRAEELRQLSVTDGLTGLYNHRHFQEHLPLEAKRAQRAGQCLALILIDIDDFKAINDTFGHAIGDELLRLVADVLTSQVRATDLAARYGGEEFVVLTQQSDDAGAQTLAEKIRAAAGGIEYRLPAVESGPAAGTRALRLTISVGVALHAPDEDTESVFEAADAALYRAKRRGKNRVELGRHCGLRDGP